jgi:DNA-binding FadR family transcriptional regulator
VENLACEVDQQRLGDYDWLSIGSEKGARMPRLVANDIATSLKKRIAAGEWMEEGRIPPERDLAGQFGVARNTVRRAVGMLEEDGTVVRHVGRGTFLAAANANSLSAAVTRMQGTSPADMMEIRQLLEPAAAAFAATNANTSELSAVGEAHRAATEATDMPAFEQWDAEFHHRIFACSRNEFLKEIHNLMRILRNQSPWFEIKKRSFSEERRQTYCREHQAILDALLGRDPEGAREAMRAHLRTVARNLLGR